MSGNFTETFGNLGYPSANNNTGTYKMQERASSLGHATEPSPQEEAQYLSYVESSHMNTMQHFGYTFPLENHTQRRLSPQTEADLDSELEPFGSLLPEIYEDLERGLVLGNSQDGAHVPPTSPQAYESYRGLFAINTTPALAWGNYHIDPEHLIPADPMIIAEPPATTTETSATITEGSVNTTETLGTVLPGYRYKTPPRAKKGLASTQTSDNRTGHGQLTSSHLASPSSPTSPGGGVAKTKKLHLCPQCGCGKTFGRMAELKRHRDSVHRDQVAKEERSELLNCHHEGCTRVGEYGFKRRDNLVQHLRGVHGEKIEKSGRKSTNMQPSPEPGAPNAGADSTATVIGNGQFPQYQSPIMHGEEAMIQGKEAMMQGEELANGWLAGDLFSPNWPY